MKITFFTTKLNTKLVKFSKTLLKSTQNMSTFLEIVSYWQGSNQQSWNLGIVSLWLHLLFATWRSAFWFENQTLVELAHPETLPWISWTVIAPCKHLICDELHQGNYNELKLSKITSDVTSLKLLVVNTVTWCGNVTCCYN